MMKKPKNPEFEPLHHKMGSLLPWYTEFPVYFRFTRFLEQKKIWIFFQHFHGICLLKVQIWLLILKIQIETHEKTGFEKVLIDVLEFFAHINPVK
jgi:hypothetical protein